MTATMATNTYMLTEAVGAACRILGYQKLTYEQEVAVKCIVKKQHDKQAPSLKLTSAPDMILGMSLSR